MKKTDAKFIASLAGCMEALTEFTCELLGTVFYKNESPMREERVAEYKSRCIQSLVTIFKNDSDKTDKLTDSLNDFVYELFNKDAFTDNKTQYFEEGKDYKLKKADFFKRKELTKSAYALEDELSKYVKDNHLDYSKDSSSFIYNYQMEAALLFQEFQFYLFNLNNVNALDMEYFERYKNVISYSHSQVFFTAEVGHALYLVKNQKGEILTLEAENRLELLVVEDKNDLERYKKIPSKKHDGVRAIADEQAYYRVKDEIEKLKKEDKKENIKTEVKKKEAVKQPAKKEPLKKVVEVKKKFNFNFNFDAISLSSFLLSILPALVMITYLILLVTGVMDQITFSSSNFSGTLFGYDFEVSGAMANWLENTEHGFFSAITLGLIQVILIVVGFVLDLVIHLLFLVLAIIWFILILIFAMCLYYVFPIAITIWNIINFFRCDEDDKLVAGICMGVSIVCCISYFLIGLNII